jgi:hypothetical protein
VLVGFGAIILFLIILLTFLKSLKI